MCRTNGVVFTLPAITIGQIFTFVNMGEEAACQISISPNASDGVSFKGSATDDKDLINTLATMKKGDMVVVASLDQQVAWQVTHIRGTWAKET